MASPRLRAFRQRLIYRALLVISAIGRRIPLRIGHVLGRALGALAYHVVRRERRKALANFAIAFPDWTDAKRRDAIRAMFRHFGMSLFEIAWMPNLTRELVHKTTIVEGFDRVDAIIQERGGLIIFTAHTGNWEWLSFITGLLGHPVSVLQRERDQPEMNRYITELRAKANVRTIDRGSASSARNMLAAIRNGGILGFVIDQNIRTESVRVPFFGRPALTPIGPAKFAVRTESVVVPAVIERLPDGRHHARFLEPIYCTKSDDPVALLARVTLDVENAIRRAPEQWVWMHDRWRERPKWDVSDEYAALTAQ